MYLFCLIIKWKCSTFKVQLGTFIFFSTRSMLINEQGKCKKQITDRGAMGRHLDSKIKGMNEQEARWNSHSILRGSISSLTP